MNRFEAVRGLCWYNILFDWRPRLGLFTCDELARLNIHAELRQEVYMAQWIWFAFLFAPEISWGAPYSNGPHMDAYFIVFE